MKRAQTVKGVIEDRWYGLWFEDRNGCWKVWQTDSDATKSDAQREMTKLNFAGHRVQMVEHFHGYRPIGKIKDYRF